MGIINSFIEHTDLLAGLIALLALFRPELGSLLRGLKNKILFYPSGLIEIGFSEYGPTIGIQGTLRAIYSDQFVSSINLTLQRLEDGATYQYSWGVFRDINHVNEIDSKIINAHAFTLSVNSTDHKNIQFHDLKTKNKFAGSLLELQSKFSLFTSDKKITAENFEEIRQKFNEENNKIILENYALLGREFYWKSGAYKITFTIFTDDPIKKFTYGYKFILNEGEVSSLDLNRAWLLQRATGFDKLRPNFVYVTYGV